MSKNSVEFTDNRANVKVSYDNIRTMKFYPRGIKITDETGWSTYIDYKNFEQMSVEVYEEETK